jgi:hypothetical protein
MDEAHRRPGAAEDHVDTLAQRLTEMKLWREVESRHSRFR